MEIYGYGTKVLIEDIEGFITDVKIGHENSIEYRVSWWNGRSHCWEWVPDCAIRPFEQNANILKIGFKQ